MRPWGAAHMEPPYNRCPNALRAARHEDARALKLIIRTLIDRVQPHVSF